MYQPYSILLWQMDCFFQYRNDSSASTAGLPCNLRSRDAGDQKGLQVTMMYNDDIWWRWSQVGVFFLSIEGDGHVPMNIGDPGNILWEPPREWVRVCYWKWLVIAMGLCLFSEIDASGSMFFFQSTYQKWRFSIATLVYQSVIWLETIPKALEKSHTLPSLAIMANQINQDFGERWWTS